MFKKEETEEVVLVGLTRPVSAPEGQSLLSLAWAATYFIICHSLIDIQYSTSGLFG